MGVSPTQLQQLDSSVADIQTQVAKLSKIANEDKNTNDVVKKLNSDVLHIQKDTAKFKQSLSEIKQSMSEKVGKTQVQFLTEAIGSLRTQVTNNNRAIQASGLAS